MILDIVDIFWIFLFIFYSFINNELENIFQKLILIPEKYICHDKYITQDIKKANINLLKLKKQLKQIIKKKKIYYDNQLKILKKQQLYIETIEQVSLYLNSVDKTIDFNYEKI